jgi:hypothetical protein
MGLICALVPLALHHQLCQHVLVSPRSPLWNEPIVTSPLTTQSRARVRWWDVAKVELDLNSSCGPGWVGLDTTEIRYAMCDLLWSARPATRHPNTSVTLAKTHARLEQSEGELVIARLVEEQVLRSQVGPRCSATMATPTHAPFRLLLSSMTRRPRGKSAVCCSCVCNRRRC